MSERVISPKDIELLKEINKGSNHIYNVRKKTGQPLSTVQKRFYRLTEFDYIKPPVSPGHRGAKDYTLTPKGEKAVNKPPIECVKELNKGDIIDPVMMEKKYHMYDKSTWRLLLDDFARKKVPLDERRRLTKLTPHSYYVDPPGEELPEDVSSFPHPLRPLNDLLWEIAPAPPWCSLSPVPIPNTLLSDRNRKGDCLICPFRTTCTFSPYYSL